MASSATDEVGPVSLAARSCSVASVKPVFAQATLGTWALFPRHVLKDSRFASLTVDTQHGGERESGTRTERGTKERVGGVGAGGGRVGRGFFFLARLQAARAATQSRRSWASNAADPPTRGKSTTQLRPELVCFSLNHTQAPKSPDSQATCRLTQVATGQPSSRTEVPRLCERHCQPAPPGETWQQPGRTLSGSFRWWRGMGGLLTGHGHWNLEASKGRQTDNEGVSQSMPAWCPGWVSPTISSAWQRMTQFDRPRSTVARWPDPVVHPPPCCCSSLLVAGQLVASGRGMPQELSHTLDQNVV